MKRLIAWLRTQWGYGPVFAWDVHMLARDALKSRSVDNTT